MTMHAVTATDHNAKVERAHQQLDRIRTLVTVIQHQTLVAAAWIEFLERGRRLDA